MRTAITPTATPSDGDRRDDGDEGLLPPRGQVAQRDPELQVMRPLRAQARPGAGSPPAARLGPHLREQDDVPDRGRAGEDHGQAVDADPAAPGGRQAVPQRAHVVLVHPVRLEVAALALLELVEEALALLERVVELGEPVGDLHARGVELEPVGHPGPVGCALASGEISTG